MAAFTLINAFTHVDGHDFSCDSNELTLSMEANSLNVTTFCSNGWTELIGGVKSSSLSMSGFWSPVPDAQSYADLGAGKRPVTVGPDAVDGSVVYMLEGRSFNYQQFGSHGEAAPFTLGVQGADGYGVVRGRLLAAKQAVDSTGVLGVPFQLGEVGAGEALYATFHVFSAGTTITVVLESDEDDTFADATTRATIGPLTTAGGVWVPRVTTAISDEWWRFRVSAITGESTVAAAAAIA